MANSHTVHGVLGYLISLMGTRRKTVKDGELRWVRESDSNVQSLQCWDSIDSMTDVFRRCGCFQLCLRIQRMRLRWKCTAPRHSMPRFRLWGIPSGLKTSKLNMMQNTGWSILRSPGQKGDVQNRNWRMRIHLFGLRGGMQTLLISNAVKKTKLN